MSFIYHRDDWDFLASPMVKEVKELSQLISWPVTLNDQELQERGLYRGPERLWVFIPGAHGLEAIDDDLIEITLVRETYGGTVADPGEWVSRLMHDDYTPAPSGWLSVPRDRLDIDKLVNQGFYGPFRSDEASKRKFTIKRDRLSEPYLVDYRGQPEIDLSMKGPFASLLIPDAMAPKIAWTSGYKGRYDNYCQGNLIPFFGSDELLALGSNVYRNDASLDIELFDRLLDKYLPGFVVDRKLAAVSTEGAVWLRCQRGLKDKIKLDDYNRLEDVKVEVFDSPFTAAYQKELIGQRLLLVWSVSTDF